MIKLSAVIITFNEEKNIGRCLDSLKGIADDIVVVDSFSTDRTEEIAKAKGARFIKHKFEGHIEQKNFAATQAIYPHVLSLDADEALSDNLKESISAVKINWLCDGYYMNRLTNYCGRWITHSGWYPDRKLRLWDSRLGRWNGINPHDKYELNQGTKVGFLKGDILHYSYYSVEEHVRQSAYFSEIAAKAMHKKGKRAGISNLILNPLIKFAKLYFLQLGLLDGYAGFQIAKITARATFDKYKKLRRLSNS